MSVWKQESVEDDLSALGLWIEGKERLGEISKGLPLKYCFSRGSKVATKVFILENMLDLD